MAEGQEKRAYRPRRYNNGDRRPRYQDRNQEEGQEGQEGGPRRYNNNNRRNNGYRRNKQENSEVNWDAAAEEEKKQEEPAKVEGENVDEAAAPAAAEGTVDESEAKEG